MGCKPVKQERYLIQDWEEIGEKDTKLKRKEAGLREREKALIKWEKDLVEMGLQPENEALADIHLRLREKWGDLESVNETQEICRRELVNLKRRPGNKPRRLVIHANMHEKQREQARIQKAMEKLIEELEKALKTRCSNDLC